jgi:hypothetical protein
LLQKECEADPLNLEVAVVVLFGEKAGLAVDAALNDRPFRA